MGNTNPFKDLDAHQELMDQLQKTTDAANESINAATDAFEITARKNDTIMRNNWDALKGSPHPLIIKLPMVGINIRQNKITIIPTTIAINLDK